MQAEDPWLGNQPVQLLELQQAEDQRIEEHNDFFCQASAGIRPPNKPNPLLTRW